MRNVIYIEKEQFLVEMLKMALKEHGLNIIVPDIGVDYLYIVADVKPDLVIIDISSFDGDLSEFLKVKDASDDISSIPIVFSGRDRDKTMVGNLNIDSKYWIPKPIEPSKIFGQLSNFL